MALAVHERHLRVQGKRSHAGCRICKLRHVKCDEGVPACQRCLKANRTCLYATATADDPEVSTRFVVYVAPQAFLAADLSRSEMRAFQHFQHKTALEATGPFQSELWSKFILQVAHRNAAVRNSVVALSSMHQLFWQLQGHHDLLYEEAMHNYNKAIRHIVRTPQIEHSFDELLLCCILFCAIESLRGDFHQALQHALSGLKMIAEHRRSMTTPKQLSSIPSDLLSKAFLILQSQVMELGDPSVFKLYGDVLGHKTTIPDDISTLEEALHHLEVLMNELFRFLEDCETLFKTGAHEASDVRTIVLPEYQILKARCEKWSRAVDLLRTPTTPYVSSREQACLILQIHQAIMKIFLQSFVTGGVLDMFADELAHVLSLVEDFLQTQGIDTATDCDKQETPPSFSMTLGVVPILFMITWRCEVPKVRTRSRQLLKICNRREGVWDSKVASQLAEHILALRNQPHVKLADIQFLPERNCLVKYEIVPPEEGQSSWVPT